MERVTTSIYIYIYIYIYIGYFYISYIYWLPLYIGFVEAMEQTLTMEPEETLFIAVIASECFNIDMGCLKPALALYLETATGICMQIIDCVNAKVIHVGEEGSVYR